MMCSMATLHAQVFVLYLKAEIENVARLKLKAQSYCISVSGQSHGCSDLSI